MIRSTEPIYKISLAWQRALTAGALVSGGGKTRRETRQSLMSRAGSCCELLESY